MGDWKKRKPLESYLFDKRSDIKENDGLSGIADSRDAAVEAMNKQQWNALQFRSATSEMIGSTLNVDHAALIVLEMGYRQLDRK